MFRHGQFATFALFTLLAPGAFAARQDGLVGYFTFDDEVAPLKNSAPRSELVPDEGKRLGDALQMTFVPGKFNRAASFSNNGGAARINDWAMSLGNLGKLYSGSFSVAFWMLAPKSQDGVIMGDKESFNIAPGWTVGQRQDNHYGIRTLGDPEYRAFTPGLERQGWTHVALTVDRDKGIAIFYIDGGKQKHECKLGKADTLLGDNVATVVGASADGTHGAKALVDEVAIWNRVLRPDEIAAIGTDTKDHPARRIPEPATYGLLGAGLLATLAAAKRRKKNNA